MGRVAIERGILLDAFNGCAERSSRKEVISLERWVTSAGEGGEFLR